MIKNSVTKEAPDLRGIVFRLLIFVGLLFAISIILDGCTHQSVEPIAFPVENTSIEAQIQSFFNNLS